MHRLYALENSLAVEHAAYARERSAFERFQYDQRTANMMRADAPAAPANVIDATAYAPDSEAHRNALYHRYPLSVNGGARDLRKRGRGKISARNIRTRLSTETERRLRELMGPMAAAARQ